MAEVSLPGYRCRNCGREFMLREPIPADCGTTGRHLVEYVMLERALPYD